MTGNLPSYVAYTFVLTTFATLLLFYMALKRSLTVNATKKAALISLALLAWLSLQAVLTVMGTYNSNFNEIPPKLIVFGLFPNIICLLLLFLSRKGRRFIDNLPVLQLTYIHMVRVPVELVLWWLYLNKLIPQLMTFEGRNFDILAGLSAPLIAYFGLTKNKLSKRSVLIWNFFCLGLLLNIAINGLLSAPSPLQKFAFDQPNIALFEFPFSWLVSFIVPMVLFAHLVTIRKLLFQKDGFPT